MDWQQTLSMAAGDSLADVVLIAGRYRVLELLGAGGFGSVFRATDTLTDETVAIKVVEGGATDRFRRETSALRLLQVPGVVRLRDEFEADGRTCIVMDCVDGQPFPGRRVAGWAGLEATALALLDALGRVHSLGVIHRDLKPANVLVEADGRPVILDFGLSGGAGLGRTITQTGAVMGTPAYFAPEQLMGQRADARADLYAVGVMLYEALVGARPHADSGAGALLQRGTRAPRPVRDRAPDVPRAVAETIDALLSVRPDDRPQSAAEAIALLAGRRSVTTSIEGVFPWIGPRALVDRVVERALAGSGSRLVGAAGSGRSRLALEAAGRLQEQGRSVVRLATSGRPLGSLGELVHADALHGPRYADAQPAAEQALTAWLEAGGILVVDHHRPLDPWSRAVVDAVRHRGVVLESGDVDGEGDDDVHVLPLRAEDLTPLFGGHELLFHLPSDAASELLRRTDGLPGRVVPELRGWLRAGLARWDEGRLQVDRSALVRLGAGMATPAAAIGGDQKPAPGALADLLAWIELAWPHGDRALLEAVVGWAGWELDAALSWLVEGRFLRARADGVFEVVAGGSLDAWTDERRADAHRLIAQQLPVEATARLFHLASAGEREELAFAAADFAAATVQRGRLPEAEAIVSEALAGVRATELSLGAHRLVVERVETALSAGSAAAYQRALLDLDRTGLPTLAILPVLRCLLQAAVHVQSGQSERALELLDSVPALVEPRMERRRRGLRAQAVARDPARRAREFAELSAWAEEVGDAETLASVASWRAMVLFREGRFEEAAATHLRAAAGSARRIFGLSARLNAASALQEAGDYARAAALARAAVDDAAELRHPTYEARACWILRASTYRAGGELALDPALVDAFQDLDNAELLAVVLVTEAAVAWRSSDLLSARALAQRGAAAWHRCRLRGPELWMRALAWLAGAPAPDDLLADAQRLCVDDPLPAIAVQTAALLALAGLPLPPAALERAARDLAAIPADTLDHNQGVLTWREMADALGCPPRD